MTVLLELDDLSVGYRTGRRVRVILSGLNAKVAAGEMIGLVGPNGVGKSTLLRSIAGLQPCLDGMVRLLGEPVQGLTPAQRAQRLAAVLTDRFEPGRLSVTDVVGIGRYAHSPWFGRLSGHDHQVVAQALRQAGIEHLSETMLGQLSDGQRQRVMVARALAQQPRILLLDEPTAFLDPPSRVELLERMRLLSNELNIAVVVCTHDLEIVLRYADSLWVADRHGYLTIGAPEQLAYDRSLERVFHTPGVVLDLDLLTFQSERVGGLTATVLGEGSAAAMARHCLIRAGFRLDHDHGDASVVQVEAKPEHWQIRTQDFERICNDLTSLYSVLRNVRDSRPKE